MKRLNLNGCNAHRQWAGLDFLSADVAIRHPGVLVPQALAQRGR